MTPICFLVEDVADVVQHCPSLVAAQCFLEEALTRYWCRVLGPPPPPANEQPPEGDAAIHGPSPPPER